MTRVKRAWKSAASPRKTYLIKYKIPPDEKEYLFESTGTYAQVRFFALKCLGTNAIILDIEEKK